MQANPQKYQSIVFQRNSSNVSDLAFTVCGNTITNETSVKLLGVHVDCKLTFNSQISEICKKAGRHLNVLRRLSKTLGEKEKLMLFHAFIGSHFNYCSVVWHYCAISDILKIEKVQKRALQYVYNDFNSTYAQLRVKANRPLMYVLRLRKVLLEVFKSLNKIGPSYLHNVYMEYESRYDMRSAHNVYLPHFNTVTYGQQSQRYQGSKLWNDLSSEMKTSDTEKIFTRKLQKWDGPKCICNSCILCTLRLM